MKTHWKMQFTWALLKNVPLLTRKLNTTLNSPCVTFSPALMTQLSILIEKPNCLTLFPPRGEFQKSLAIAEKAIKTKQTAGCMYLCSFPSWSVISGLETLQKFCG